MIGNDYEDMSPLSKLAMDEGASFDEFCNSNADEVLF